MTIRPPCPDTLPTAIAPGTVLDVATPRVPPAHNQVPLTHLVGSIERTATGRDDPPGTAPVDLRGPARADIDVAARHVQPPAETRAIRDTGLVRVQARVVPLVIFKLSDTVPRKLGHRLNAFTHRATRCSPIILRRLTCLVLPFSRSFPITSPNTIASSERSVVALDS